MKKTRTNGLYRRSAEIIVAALTGNARMSVTIVVYSVLAVLLLAYVSMQVLSGVLAQEITSLTQEKNRQSEIMNRLTAEYVSLSSRARVSKYCESVLGMRQATQDDYQRIAVSISDDRREHLEFTKYVDTFSDPYGFSTLTAANGKSDG